MFPDITYFFYYFFDIKPDGILSFIKTYGLFQTISFGLFYYFTYEVIKERIVTDFNILNKVNFSRIVLILLIPTILLIFKIAIISKLILILILISIYFIDSKNFSLKQKYFFFLVTLLIIGFFGSTAQIIIEDYIISNKIMHSGRLGFFGGVFFIFLFLVYIFMKFPFSIDIINKNCKYVFLSYSIGKLGCHLSGDGDWGKVNNTDYKNIFFNILFKCSYKYNVINEGYKITTINTIPIFVPKTGAFNVSVQLESTSCIRCCLCFGMGGIAILKGESMQTSNSGVPIDIFLNHQSGPEGCPLEKCCQ